MVELAGLAGSTTMPSADFVPLYQRVMNDINQKIEDGRWPPGHKLPSTVALAEEYDVSPGTVRDAVTRLTERGILRGHQGIGVFVAEQ